MWGGGGGGGGGGGEMDCEVGFGTRWITRPFSALLQRNGFEVGETDDHTDRTSALVLVRVSLAAPGF